MSIQKKAFGFLAKMIQCIWLHVSIGKWEEYYIVSECRGGSGWDVFALL